MKDGAHLWMSDTASYSCAVKTHDENPLSHFCAADKGLLRGNDQVSPVMPMLLRCNDLRLIVMSAYLLSNLLMEVFSVEDNVVPRRNGCQCGCMILCGLVVDR